MCGLPVSPSRGIRSEGTLISRTPETRDSLELPPPLWATEAHCLQCSTIRHCPPPPRAPGLAKVPGKVARDSPVSKFLKPGPGSLTPFPQGPQGGEEHRHGHSRLSLPQAPLTSTRTQEGAWGWGNQAL